MAETVSNEAAEAGAVAVYKRIFKEVLDSRPSGMRLRLATAIGKNRSFVSQIPIRPIQFRSRLQHLNTIFEVCISRRSQDGVPARLCAGASAPRRPVDRWSSRSRADAASARSRQCPEECAARHAAAGICAAVTAIMRDEK